MIDQNIIKDIEEKKENNVIEENENKEKLHLRMCPHCKQQYKTTIGIKNWKNLFKKPTAEDWITLLILILVMVAAFAYTLDIKTCKETLNNLDEMCLARTANYTIQLLSDSVFNLSSLKLLYNITNVTT
jgi:hypothetical protein